MGVNKMNDIVERKPTRIANTQVDLIKTGLIMPKNITEEEHKEVGKWLSKAEQGMQWALGDWYNSIPKRDKKKACEDAGINYKQARNCANVVNKYPEVSLRRDNLGFEIHKVLAIKDLTSEQRQQLLQKAGAESLTVKQVTVERDKMLGRYKEPMGKPESLDQFVEQVTEGLTKAHKKKVQMAARKVHNQLARDYSKAVKTEVDKQVKTERDRLHEVYVEARQERNLAADIRRGLRGTMTLEEYKLILSCLHPDKAPKDRIDRFAKAFGIFKRMKNTVNDNLSRKELRKKGWENAA